MINNGAKCYIVRHVKPQARTVGYPPSEVYKLGYGDYDSALKGFWEQVAMALFLGGGEKAFVVHVLPSGDLRAYRVEDERDVIEMRASLYGAEGRGVGTGYWAEKA
jgi:hypothetical protein